MVKKQILVAGLVEVPLSLLTVVQIEKIRKDLTFTLPDDDFGGFGKETPEEERRIAIFSEGVAEGSSYIGIPRYYFWEKVFPSLKKNGLFAEPVAKIVRLSNPWFMAKKFRLRPDQQIAVDKMTCSGILAAATSKGKTLMALAAASGLQAKTLVVVPTEILLSQWRARILEHTTLRDDQIGIVKGPKCQIDRPFLLGMVQSLAQRQYPDILYASVQCLITDEVHRIGARTWLSVVPKFRAPMRWGLSATVERRDGMHEAFMWHIGPILHEMFDRDVLPRVAVIETGIILEPRQYTNPWNGLLNMSKLQTALGGHPRRNKIVAREIHAAWKAGRKILVLSRRVDQLHELYRLLHDAHAVPPYDLGVLTGDTGKKKSDRGAGLTREAFCLRILQSRRIILATEQFAGLGLDEKTIDTLMWATPSQSVEQNAGRLRGDELPGKKTLLVVDFVDAFPIAERLAKARLRKFEDCNYEVKDYGHD
jgi:superfamily II DNA or RNA helicase